MSKPCEYCGCDLPEGVDKSTRRIRSYHFSTCPKRSEIKDREARERRAEKTRDTYYRLTEAGFTEDQAVAIIELYGTGDAS